MRMKLGMLFLTHDNGVKTSSMIIDNLMLFDVQSILFYCQN